MPNYQTKFNQNWIKLYPWVCEVNDDIHKAYCRLCKCEIKVGVRGVGSLKQHKEAAKHRILSAKSAASKNNSTESTLDHPSDDNDVKKEDCSDQQETKDFEECWMDPDSASTSTTSTTKSSLDSDQENDEKNVLHPMHRKSTPYRKKRKLSKQRMKMFEAELRVWQRKGEAIVKLMETVGHDKEMWEIINKQSRLHERERDRIREEYDIL